VVRERVVDAAPPNVSIVHYESTKAFMANVAASGKSFDWLKEELGAPVQANEAGAKSSTESRNSN
jgi:hypothetical protein